jgi:hypothetical protein
MQLDAALESHMVREAKLSEFRRDYDGQPEVPNKSFPWPNCSNVVVPLVAIAVDAIVARLMKAIMGLDDIVEVEIKSQQWEPLERDIRDWVKWFFTQAKIKDKLRTVFFDMALGGGAIIHPIWTSRKRVIHAYDPAGAITSAEVVDYEGPEWDVPALEDVVVPVGFDEWGQLPWVARRLRMTWGELRKLKRDIPELQGVEKLKAFLQERDDQRFKDNTEGQFLSTVNVATVVTLYEITGEIELPEKDGKEAVEPEFIEAIFLYHRESDTILRAIHNPFFGNSRFYQHVPYLVQAHRLFGKGAAEQAQPFQREASTAHNQMIDAATAANAGIVCITPETNMGPKQEIHPGAVLVDENPQNIRVIHLSSPEPALGGIEEKAIRYSETRTGVSAYHLGMESTIVGSRATATGTTALINEGNIRVWVSIEDMREALNNALYMTIQLVQQMQPEGVQISPEKVIVFPQGDVRTSLGLNMKIADEIVNKDAELQNLQVLMAVLNEYYAKLNQAAGMIMNPQFPPEMKNVSVQVMLSAHDLVRRFVERFKFENIDVIVPNILTILQQSAGANNAAAQATGQPGMAPGAPPIPPGGPPGAPGGIPPSPIGPPNVGGIPGPPPVTGQGAAAA